MTDYDCDIPLGELFEGGGITPDCPDTGASLQVEILRIE